MTRGRRNPGGKTSATSSTYVPALDGLRAVAVLLVVLFHLKAPAFAAGYLGVDMFFVLSGFLITSILLAEMDRTGRVNLSAFWARRVRRLMPALGVLLLTVAGSTWLTATFTERASLRFDLLASTLYVANWRFIGTTSYFNSTGVESPLLHTWSLAIEEQFYLLWPLLLAGGILLLKRPRLMVGTLGAVGIVASAAMLWLHWAPGDTARAYMGTDARIFEPLVGALGAVVVRSGRGRDLVARASRALIPLGILGVVAGLVVIRPDTPFYYRGGALAFSVATLMVLAPLWIGRGGRLRAGLEARPLVWLGTVSYGVYLWHWPIILWLGQREASGPQAVVLGLIAVTLTVLVSALSYRYIEQPIRHGRRRAHADRQTVRRHRWALAAVPLGILVIGGVSIAATVVPPPSQKTPVVMLAGDSVPKHLEVAMDREASERGWRLVSAARGGCSVTGELATSQRNGTTSERCPQDVTSIQDRLLQTANPDVVVWWDRWSLADFISDTGENVRSGTRTFWRLRTQALDERVSHFNRHGAIVLFVATEPPGRGITAERCTERACNSFVNLQIEGYDDVTTRWNQVMRRYARTHPDGAAFVSFIDAVCRTEESPCDDRIAGAPARPDGTHYEGAGQERVITMLSEKLEGLIDGPRRSDPDAVASG